MRSRLLRALARFFVAALALVLLKAAWFASQRASADRSIRGQDREEMSERRAYLVERVSAPDFGPRSFPEALGDPFRGEWAIVSLSMTALALSGMVRQFPAEVGTTESDLQKIIDRALSSDLAEFDSKKWNEAALDSLASPRGHVGYLGHLALTVAVDEVTFPKGPHRALLGRLTEALTRKLEQAPGHLAETYPGEVYLPDNAVALAAIALAERAGVAQAGSATSLLARVHEQHADKKTGLLPFRPGRDGSPGEVRASGASWSLLYLALVDEAYAQRGYRALRDQFFDRPAPLVAGLREWPRGVDRRGDVDSGPLLLGLSPAASGFAIALARRDADEATLQALLDTAELVGSTLSLRGRRSYLLAPLVGDAILLAARAPL